jgi:hypothetical protein
MYIAHYKSVSSPEEFFSSPRESLDFPTQVEFEKKRYLLNATHHVISKSNEKRIIAFAEANNIKCNVEV